MNHLSLFSGIGGLDLAAEWAGFETVAFVERDPYCQRVLAKRWPGVPVVPDIKAVCDPAGARRGEGEPGARGPLWDGAWWPESGGRDRASGVSIISGGFPCQPHSVAGKRQASADDRDLWPEVARVLREIRPRWFVGENVRGLLHSESGRFFGRILGDLADMGYRVGWGVWGASDVGALHQRERVFIVAHAGYEPEGRPAAPGEAEGWRALGDASGRGVRPEMADANEPGLEGRLGRGMQERAGEWPVGARGASDEGRALHDPLRGRHGSESGEVCPGWDGTLDAGWWSSEPDVGRVAHGVPSRVDRLRALGNAVVPQQAYPLFKAIADIEMSQQQYRQGGC